MRRAAGFRTWIRCPRVGEGERPYPSACNATEKTEKAMSEGTTMNTSKEAEEFFAWRSRERQKHRVMTAAEYNAWRRVGDVLSCPSESNAFPGGLTILFGPNNGVLGYTTDENQSSPT